MIAMLDRRRQAAVFPRDPNVKGDQAAVTDEVPSRRSAASTSKRSSVSGNVGVRGVSVRNLCIAEAIFFFFCDPQDGTVAQEYARCPNSRFRL